MGLNKYARADIEQIVREYIACCCSNNWATTTLNPPVAEPGTNDPKILFNVTEGILWFWNGSTWEEFGGAGGSFGVTTLSPPVSAPVGNDPVYLGNTSTGIIYYWNGSAWTIASGDTNLATTDLVQGSNRTYNLNGFSLLFFGSGGDSSYAFNADDGISSAAVQLLLQPTLVDLNQTSTSGLLARMIMNEGILKFDAVTGVYEMQTQPLLDNTVLLALGYNTTTKRLVTITKPVDTNITTGNLAFSVSRTHDLVGNILKFIGQVGASFDVVITGPSGDHELHIDEDDVRLKATQSATQYTQLDINVLDLTLESRNNSLRHSLEILPTYARLLSGSSGADGVIRVDANAVYLYSTVGVYKFDKGDGTLSLPSISDSDVTHGLGVKASDGRIYRTTKALIASDITNVKLDNFNLNLNGNGTVITTGYADRFIVPFACTITGWTLLETSSTPIATSSVITVKKGAYSDYDTTPIFNAISGTEKPTLTTAVANQDLSLSTWTTSLAAGDILEYSIDSNDLGKKLLLVLHVSKT